MDVSSKSFKSAPLTGGHAQLQDGEKARFTLTVSKTNASTSVGGLYRVLLKAIGWNTDNSSTYNVYDFNLSDFKTDYISTN